MPAPGIIFSFLLSISHRSAAMEIASALNLIAQPQTEGPAAGLGYFHIFFLSGLHHCNMSVFQPFCDRGWGEYVSCTPEALPVPVSHMWWGMLGCLWDPRLPGEPLRRSTLNQNASSVPFDMSPLGQGKGFKPLQLPQVVFLALHRTSLLRRSIRPAWAGMDACPWLGQRVLQWKLLS